MINEKLVNDLLPELQELLENIGSLRAILKDDIMDLGIRKRLSRLLMRKFNDLSRLTDMLMEEIDSMDFAPIALELGL